MNVYMTAGHGSCITEISDILTTIFNIWHEIHNPSAH
jgi:hypothetical protein